MTGSKKNKYYDVFDDLKKYPNATIIIAYSRRGVGKTYSALKGALERKQKIVYIKRTMADVDLICSASETFDTSPYKPINRDCGTNIKPHKIAPGIGSFNHYNDDNEPVGAPVAYAVALSAIKNMKGIDFSDCDFIIFDEFIPQVSETRISANESECLMDLYETVSRDRIKRGREELKMLLFANAENIYCNIVDGLEILDELAEIAVSGARYKWIESRNILIHHVNEIELTDAEKQGGLYKVMAGTAWHKKAYGGEFSKADFSNISKSVLKNYGCLMMIHYRQKDFYIYQKDDHFYIGNIKSNRFKQTFNLNRDNDVRLFYLKYVLDIQEACINGNVKFSSYSLYDLIMNYPKRFKNIL